CRRRKVADHPPRLDDPPAAQRRGAAGRRDRARDDPDLDRHRGHRGHPLGPGPGAGQVPGRGSRAGWRLAQRGRQNGPLDPQQGVRGALPKVSAVGERNELGLTAWDRYRILTTYRTIAMVGLSSNYYNASSFAAIYLDANGYDIVPVNPAQAGKREIMGRRVYASLREAAADHAIEIVDVFRPSREVVPIAREAVEIGAKVLWMQLGVINEEAASI